MNGPDVPWEWLRRDARELWLWLLSWFDVLERLLRAQMPTLAPPLQTVLLLFIYVLLALLLFRVLGAVLRLLAMLFLALLTLHLLWPVFVH